MSDINQDDIDKMLQDALVGDDSANADAPEPAEPAEAGEDRGPASQDDIDALFAAVGSQDSDSEAPAADDAPSDPEGGAGEEEEDVAGVASQDDIDALFSTFDVDEGASGKADADPVESDPPAAAEAPPADDGEPALEMAGQDDIDALLAAVDAETGAETRDAPAASPADADETAGDSETELFESRLAEAEARADDEREGEDAELDELLSSIAAAGEDDLAGEGEKADAASGPAAAFVAAGAGAPGMLGDKDETVRMDTVDMDELLRQVNDAAPPPPPKAASDVLPPVNVTDTTVDAEPDVAPPRAGTASPPPAAPTPSLSDTIVAPPIPAQAMAAAASAERREFSVLYGAGEVEGVANQISALLSAMSEKAHGYMQAWIAADSEAKELRTRALAEERRRAVLESEKSVLSRETDELRSRLAGLEGAKVAAEEARRTLETAKEAKIRELESRITLLSSESESLKDELTRARNEATGVDIASRRARFEADRLKNELESERMERLRIQRALENREKEIQAMQSQSAGQASSLFIDELHRLVRRLESELDTRTSGAHEALKQLDRLDVPADMVPIVANIRAALIQAVGADADADDALKSLGREAESVRGPQAVMPGKAEMVSFETALSTYNLVGAVDIAGALLREARATPGSLMRKIYQCPALRRSEVGEHLGDLSRLLEGLRTVQESGDRSRGRETGESEVFFVQMFDFLHNLVRLKIVTRLSGDAWRLFLDLRGRFSFVTSDKQWAEYRDQTLGGKGLEG